MKGQALSLSLSLSSVVGRGRGRGTCCCAHLDILHLAVDEAVVPELTAQLLHEYLVCTCECVCVCVCLIHVCLMCICMYVCMCMRRSERGSVLGQEGARSSSCAAQMT